MQTDPIADMLTRIRNGLAIAVASVDVPASRFKRALADILVREGYLKAFEETVVAGHPVLRIYLKYGPRRSSIIHSLRRVSSPGRRAYTKAKSVPVVRGGLGIAIISTPQGLLVDREARRNNVGGEVVCEVW
ncbi:MAG: 30S ribosomal protein S8 [Trueperaceae bacterium]|nr:MAG: 30S ribosomal protein S8 [Trueperaceae bacterium]